jgi:hypothetical protein
MKHWFDVARLLCTTRRCESEVAHGEIAAMLWDAASDADAVTSLRRLAAEQLDGWEAEAREQGPQEPGRGGGLNGGRGRGRDRGTRSDEEY